MTGAGCLTGRAAGCGAYTPSITGRPGCKRPDVPTYTHLLPPEVGQGGGGEPIGGTQGGGGALGGRALCMLLL